MCPVKVAGIVLAAGASRRMGRAKQELVLAGETLLERAVRLAFEAGLAPLVVVIRADSGRWSDSLRARGYKVLVNEFADEGMASSIRCGVGCAAEFGVDGAVLMTCDQVMLQAEHLRRLSRNVGRVTGSRYGGRTGVPAYFPKSSFGALLELRGDVGARDLLRGAEVVADEKLTLDVDTQDDWERAKQILG